MRKLVVLGLVVAGAALGGAVTFQPARAGCHGGYLYDYYCASPAYRFALAPWGYRTAPQAYDAGGGAGAGGVAGGVDGATGALGGDAGSGRGARAPKPRQPSSLFG